VKQQRGAQLRLLRVGLKARRITESNRANMRAS
jgi:hypothetical protein